MRSAYFFVILWVVVVAVATGCSSPESQELPAYTSTSTLPVYSPESPISVEIFAPGVVNSTWPEFGITFTAAGDTVYFTRTIKDRTKASIMRSVIKDGIWQDPEVSPFSGPTYDFDPFVMPDGSLFYGSLQYDVERDSLASVDLWMWSNTGAPIRLPRPFNSDYNESFVTGSRDGTMVFGSNRNGPALIFRSAIVDGVRQAPVILPIPGVISPGNPLLSPDGTTLIFASEWENGETELAFMCSEMGIWSAPQSFPAPINSAYMEYAPGMDPDGYLYFASERSGMATQVEPGGRSPSDIYKSNLKIQDLCKAE